jgi:hypothetical protein
MPSRTTKAARWACSLPINDIQMDRRVLIFSVDVSLLTTVACGLAPALQASRVSVTDALNQGGTRGTLGGSSTGMRNGLVVAQIALSCMLAVNGVSCFGRSSCSPKRRWGSSVQGFW